MFWYHSKQHDSKTIVIMLNKGLLFWYHSKQHDSKTHTCLVLLTMLFWHHSKQHDSKTGKKRYLCGSLFWYHSKQHDSKTSENYFFSMIPYSHHLSIARFQFRRSNFFLHVYYTKLFPSWRKNPPFFNGGFSLFSSCNSEPDFTILSFCWSLILRKRNFWCCNDLVTR
ncbi:predicted protein [Enterococcus faecalis T3]|nr:predicted protein [Enterococcus faecalis T3]